ncbi:unnamed protein product [Heterobilharzia americana]|nr:unnamed protein product [Heterobilharzia americana]
MDNTNKNDIHSTKSNWVLNILNKKLTQVEENILIKEMNFDVTNRALKPEDFISCKETTSEECDGQTTEIIRAQCALTFNQQKMGY